MAVAALVLVVVVWLVSRDEPPGPGADPGAAAAEEFVGTYIAALNADDPTGLAAVLGETPDSAEITARLDRYGGLGLRDVRVSLVNEFPRIYRVSISASSDDGRSVEMTEVLEWTGTRWHFAPLPSPAP